MKFSKAKKNKHSNGSSSKTHNKKLGGSGEYPNSGKSTFFSLNRGSCD